MTLQEEIDLKDDDGDYQKCDDVASSTFYESDKKSPWKRHFSRQVR